MLLPSEIMFVVVSQVVLINAVKDVAKALGDLISATKAAAGKPHDDPAMLQLKSSAKVKTLGAGSSHSSTHPVCLHLRPLITDLNQNDSPDYYGLPENIR